MFRRLAVFAGSFSLDAARAVGVATKQSADGMLAAIGRLVDKSLLAVDHHDGIARYACWSSVS